MAAKKSSRPFGSDRFIVTKARYLRMLSIFVSKEETRYHLNGIHLEPNGSGIVAVATDGRRMGIIRDTEGRCREPYICPLSNMLLSTAKHHLKDDADLAAVFAGHEVYLVPAKLVKRVQGSKSAASYSLYSETLPPIDGLYPEWPRVIPREIKRRARPLHVNATYMADFAKVARIGGVRDHHHCGWAIHQTGGEADPVIVRTPKLPEFIGVQMPMRVDQIEPLPKWLPEKAA